MKDKYLAANPDGDNLNAVNVFLETLSVVNYTRDLSPISKYPDIFSLVQFYKNCNFFDALKWICSDIGLSTYDNLECELPESVQLSRMLLEMVNDGECQTKEKPLKPIPENILSYYKPYVNDMFMNDNIPYEVQRDFEVGYDPCTNRITIPIRNYDGMLVGVKGRLFKEQLEEGEQKYVYIEPCSKGQVLYGLDKTIHSIQRKKKCYVGESEKFVMQLFSYGYTNCVATGGKTISKHQIEMLSRMNVDIVLCFDRDVEIEELQRIADNFLGDVNVSAIVDHKGILVEHESPSDNKEKWEKLNEECTVKLR